MKRWFLLVGLLVVPSITEAQECVPYAFTLDGCSNCVIADNVQCSPSFVGPLTAYEGWRLTPGSPGVGLASDGLDMGIVVLQEEETVIPGKTVMAFDHDGIDTDRYTLAIGESPRVELEVEQEGTTYSFTLPSSVVARGPQVFVVWAEGEGGITDSDSVSFRIVGPPSKPTNLRKVAEDP